MNLIKWFRKNNKKLLAVMVVVLMFGFIGGSFLRQMALRSSGHNATVATIFGDEKIKASDTVQARQELEILQLLGADSVLKEGSLHTVPLGELLFQQRNASPLILMRMKNQIRQNQINISDEQLHQIYQPPENGMIYWIVLTREAERAGITISTKQAGDQLRAMIPRVMQNRSYAQAMQQIIDRTGYPEEGIQRVFAKLLEVINYAQIACSSENLTRSQIKNAASFGNETMDVNQVPIDAGLFAAEQSEPAREEMVEHFNRYKQYFDGTITEDNPWGFGYKPGERVQTEYLIVKLNEVEQLISEPTPEEAEDYYQRNVDRFTESVPTDPNDPNSPRKEETKKYAEVSEQIMSQLRRDKINSRAVAILEEARRLIERPFEQQDVAVEELTDEEYAKLAADYKEVGTELSKKYQVPVYTGKTGLLQASDVRDDPYLRTLFIEGQNQVPVWLIQILFTIDELNSAQLGPFDVPSPRLNETIGPLKDSSGNVMAMVRATEIKTPTVPSNIDVTYDKKPVTLGDAVADSYDYSVIEDVKQDVKEVRGFEDARSKAVELAGMIKDLGWDKAIGKLNKTYNAETDKDPNDPNAFAMSTRSNIKRIPESELQFYMAQSAGSVSGRSVISNIRREKLLIDKLWKLVPSDGQKIQGPKIVEFKPNRTFYVVKDLNINRLTKQEFNKQKVTLAYMLEAVEAQSLAPVFYNPENILERVNFKRHQEPAKKPADANTSSQNRDQ